MKRDGIWDGSLTCFEAATGRVRWSRRYDHPFFSTPLRVGGRLWASCGDVVRCFELTSGRELWAYRPDHFSLYPPMVFAAGRLFAPDGDGWTYVLDPDTGGLIERFLMPRGTGLASDGDRIFAACGVHGLRAYDPLTCCELWHTGRWSTYYTGRPALRAQDLVVAASDGNVALIDKAKGLERWSFQLGDMGGATVALGLDCGFAITGAGELLAFTLPGEMLGTEGSFGDL
jgi:outer membrane protein assembly factor BamB